MFLTANKVTHRTQITMSYEKTHKNLHAYIFTMLISITRNGTKVNSANGPLHGCQTDGIAQTSVYLYNYTPS